MKGCMPVCGHQGAFETAEFPVHSFPASDWKVMRKLYIVPNQNYITPMGGDTVNVAQHLQTVAKPGQILIQK